MDFNNFYDKDIYKNFHLISMLISDEKNYDNILTTLKEKHLNEYNIDNYLENKKYNNFYSLNPFVEQIEINLEDNYENYNKFFENNFYTNFLYSCLDNYNINNNKKNKNNDESIKKSYEEIKSNPEFKSNYMVIKIALNSFLTIKNKNNNNNNNNENLSNINLIIEEHLNFSNIFYENYHEFFNKNYLFSFFFQKEFYQILFNLKDLIENNINNNNIFKNIITIIYNLSITFKNYTGFLFIIYLILKYQNKNNNENICDINFEIPLIYQNNNNEFIENKEIIKIKSEIIKNFTFINSLGLNLNKNIIIIFNEKFGFVKLFKFKNNIKLLNHIENNNNNNFINIIYFNNVLLCFDKNEKFNENFIKIFDINFNDVTLNYKKNIKIDKNLIDVEYYYNNIINNKLKKIFNCDFDIKSFNNNNDKIIIFYDSYENNLYILHNILNLKNLNNEEFKNKFNFFNNYFIYILDIYKIYNDEYNIININYKDSIIFYNEKNNNNNLDYSNELFSANNFFIINNKLYSNKLTYIYNLNENKFYNETYKMNLNFNNNKDNCLFIKYKNKIYYYNLDNNINSNKEDYNLNLIKYKTKFKNNINNDNKIEKIINNKNNNSMNDKNNNKEDIYDELFNLNFFNKKKVDIKKEKNVFNCFN